MKIHIWDSTPIRHKLCKFGYDWWIIKDTTWSVSLLTLKRSKLCGHYTRSRQTL